MNNNTNKEHILVAWNDTDVPVLIKDKAFAGKLAPAKSTAKGRFYSFNLVFNAHFCHKYTL